MSFCPTAGNARWVLQKHPLLATTQPNPEIDEMRYTLTFESSIVSRTCLVLFVICTEFLTDVWN